MLRIYIGFQATKILLFSSPKTTTTTTTTTFLLFFILLLLISIGFPPPHSIVFYPSPTRFIFFSTRFYKRLPTAIISSVCRNVSSCQEQSWFSSTLSCLSSSSATVSFTDSQSTTTTCISPSLIQCT